MGKTSVIYYVFDVMDSKDFLGGSSNAVERFVYYTVVHTGIDILPCIVICVSVRIEFQDSKLDNPTKFICNN